MCEVSVEICEVHLHVEDFKNSVVQLCHAVIYSFFLLVNPERPQIVHPQWFSTSVCTSRLCLPGHAAPPADQMSERLNYSWSLLLSSLCWTGMARPVLKLCSSCSQ